MRRPEGISKNSNTRQHHVVNIIYYIRKIDHVIRHYNEVTLSAQKDFKYKKMR